MKIGVMFKEFLITSGDVDIGVAAAKFFDSKFLLIVSKAQKMHFRVKYLEFLSSATARIIE